MLTIPANLSPRSYLTLSALFVAYALGLVTAYWLYHPKGLHETPAAAVRQSDGSLILERKPETASQLPVIKQAIPRGDKVIRRVEVAVQSTARPVAMQGGDSSVVAPLPSDCIKPFESLTCPTVHVDLSLVTQKDKMQRVIASSPDGKIIAGLDMPVEPVIIPHAQHWNLMYIRSFDGRNGAQINYSTGPFVVGAGALPGTVFASAGIRF